MEGTPSSPVPTVWGCLSSIPLAESYLTLKHSLGKSSLSLQSLTPEYVRVPQHQIYDLGGGLPDKGGHTFKYSLPELSTVPGTG